MDKEDIEKLKKLHPIVEEIPMSVVEGWKTSGLYNSKLKIPVKDLYQHHQKGEEVWNVRKLIRLGVFSRQTFTGSLSDVLLTLFEIKRLEKISRETSETRRCRLIDEGTRTEAQGLLDRLSPENENSYISDDGDGNDAKFSYEGVGIYRIFCGYGHMHDVYLIRNLKAKDARDCRGKTEAEVSKAAENLMREIEDRL